MKAVTSIIRSRGNATIKASGRVVANNMVQLKTRFTGLGLIALSTAALWTWSSAAITVTPLGKGQLPSGDFIVMTQLTLNPGESVSWHYHPGTGLRIVLSGTITEDEGCGNALIAHTAGSAFEETPGHVHRVFNLGSEPVVVLRTDVLPPCYVNEGTIFVTGPDCEGDSGRSHLVPIEPCPSAASNPSATAQSAHLAVLAPALVPSQGSGSAKDSLQPSPQLMALLNSVRLARVTPPGEDKH